MLKLCSALGRHRSRRLPCLTLRFTNQPAQVFSSTSGPEDSAQQTPRPPPAAKSFAFTAVCGAGLLYYFNREKNRIAANRHQEAAGAVGTPKLGGPLQLTDQHGNPFDSTKLKDKFLLVYFGFTHCPDVCPEELDRMGAIMNIIEKEPTETKLLPVFVTVDPDRDGPAQIREYLKDFHPSFVGLTGTKEEVKAAARKYRIYFRPARTSGSATDSRDYLVDHSIFFFLVDPEGKYVTHFGRDSSVEKSAKIILDALHSWDISK